MSTTLAIVLEVTLKSSVVLGLAAVLTGLLRRRAAGVRHAIWSGALSAVLVLPLVVVAGPRLRIVPGVDAVFGIREAAGAEAGPAPTEGVVSAAVRAAVASPEADPVMRARGAGGGDAGPVGPEVGPDALGPRHDAGHGKDDEQNEQGPHEQQQNLFDAQLA